MRFWTREIAGWLLILIALGIFFTSFELYVAPPGRGNILGAAGLSFIGFIIFRGGIHLLKVAAAVQVCQQARQEADRPAPRLRPLERPDHPWPSL